MNQKLLTDAELRAHWAKSHEAEYFLEEGTILTPAAKDFIREQNIRLCYRPSPLSYQTMTQTPIPTAGKARYIDALSGKGIAEKPEEMTHLRGNLLVPKTHPRIAFRGQLDSLMAQLLDVQCAAAEENHAQIAEELEALLDYIREILAAEVKEQPLAEIRLLGLDSAGIRRVSHHVREEIGIEHPIPSYRMGRLCVALNRLRTQVRETELFAAAAFADEEGRCIRRDIVEGLNRLSSCVYILFCRKLAGYYDQEKTR